MITLDFYIPYLFVTVYLTVWSGGGALGYHVTKYSTSHEKFERFLNSLHPILKYYFSRKAVYDVPKKKSHNKNMKLADYIKLNECSDYQERRFMGLLPPALMALLLFVAIFLPISTQERISNAIALIASLAYFRSVYNFGNKLKISR